jgi:hypothetical protein
MGPFATGAEAAAAYDRAALKLPGAGAATNGPAGCYPAAAVKAALLEVRSLHEVKGVVMRANSQQVQWHVQVCTNRVTYKLGYVGSRERAARLYDAILLHCCHPGAGQLCSAPPRASTARRRSLRSCARWAPGEAGSVCARVARGARSSSRWPPGSARLGQGMGMGRERGLVGRNSL